MPNRAKIFLSSPMPGTPEWRTIRDSVKGLFSYGGLGTVFALTQIEDEGGDELSTLYLDQVSEASILLVIFKTEIRPGQLREIDFAIDHGIPLIPIRIVEPDAQINPDTLKYMETRIYPKYKVSDVYTHSDLLEHISSTLVGFVRRRLKQVSVEKNAVEFTAKSEEFVEQKYETVAEFCAYCVEQDYLDSALSIAKHLNKDNDASFLLYTATVLACDSYLITQGEAERLESLACDNDIALIALCAYLHRRREYEKASTVLAVFQGAKNDEMETLSRYLSFVDELPSNDLTVDEIVDFWKDAETVGGIRVLDMPVFKAEESDLAALLEDSLIDISEYVPTVERCATCMPWEGREIVEITRELGDVEDLTADNLSDSQPEIPWYLLKTKIKDLPSCRNCYAQLEEYDSVFEGLE